MAIGTVRYSILKFFVPIKKILARTLVFMGGFGVWAQVWSKGSCVGNVKVGSSILLVSSINKNR